MTIAGIELHPSIAAVVDTNVLTDVFTCTDLVREYTHPTLPPAEAAQTREAVFRRARVRESLLLCWHFHRSQWQTFGLVQEHLNVMSKKLAPPEQVHDFETHFTTWFVWFVKDYVLDGWDNRGDPKIGDGLKNAERDDLLVATAQRNTLPLITNEGYSSAGVSDAAPNGMRSKALKAGVRVYTPRQFCEAHFGMGNGNGDDACQAFLERYDAQAPLFLRSRSQSTRDTIGTMRGYYSHVLFGITQQPGERLAVSL